IPRTTASWSSSIAAGVPPRTRNNSSRKRSRSTARKGKPPDGRQPPTRLLTCRGTRSTLDPSMPLRGCPSMARSTGYARSTAMNRGTTNCAPKPSIAVALPRTPTLRTTQGCSSERHAPTQLCQRNDHTGEKACVEHYGRCLPRRHDQSRSRGVKGPHSRTRGGGTAAALTRSAQVERVCGAVSSPHNRRRPEQPKAAEEEARRLRQAVPLSRLRARVAAER